MESTQTPLLHPQSAPFRPALAGTWQHLVLLVVLGLLAFFVGLGAPPLLEPDEGRNAEIAREMLVSGDWITPHYDGVVYLDKPAAFFWLVATSFRAFGVSEWAARFPSALLGLATLIMAWALGSLMFPGLGGLRAGVVLASSPLMIVEARLVGFDMFLTFLITLAMACFWLADSADPACRSLGVGRPHPVWQDALLFGAMGLAAITKGPVGFLLPLLSILAYLGLRGRLRDVARLRWGLGIGVFLAEALPWFVAVSLRNPDFPRYAFWQESLVRFATGQARRGGSALYYVPVYLAGFFPWSFFLLFAGWNARRRWRQLREDAQKPVAFFLAWAGVVFLFFTLSRSKLPAYFLPAIIPLSFLMAMAWDSPGRTPEWLTRGFGAMMAVGLLSAGGASWLDRVLRVRLEKRFHPSVLATLKPSLVYSGLILFALALLGRNLAVRAKSRASSWRVFAIVALIFPLVLVRCRPALRALAATASSRQLAEAIRSSPEKDLAIYGYYYFRTGLPFYLRRPVGLVTGGGGELTSNYILTRFAGLRPATLPGGLPLFADPAGLAAQAEHQSLLVITRNTHVGSLAHAVGRIEPMWEGWEFSVWKVGWRRP